jgi:NAD(P)-binding Rossmann-like domain
VTRLTRFGGEADHVPMGSVIHADYLVVGAGATGMAFVDALVDHADVRVVMVDRRYGVGGHWLDAYPFVRLHLPSAFYGVASTPLDDGTVQRAGPEKGLHQRASAPEIVAYYARVLERLMDSGKVNFFPKCEYVGGNQFVSLLSGRRYEVSDRCRIVDARYLSPDIPACTPPPFAVVEGARVIPVNELVNITDAPRMVVLAGSGKTATDACIWLLDNGVDPDAICWVRPREPWMHNRAALQPDPAVMLAMAANTMIAAAAASTADDLFLGLEKAGVMLRIDPSVVPTMAKAPTIAQWEIDRLRTIENVVRLGHIRHVEPGRIALDHGNITLPANTVVVHCAASGLKYPPAVPIWGREVITLQIVRPGFPCFGAAVIGYVEATRDNDDDKNRLCLPTPLPDTPASWARMQTLGNRAARSLSAEPDVKTWSNQTSLNPARIPPERAGDPDVIAGLDRLRTHVSAGMSRLAEFSSSI